MFRRTKFTVLLTVLAVCVASFSSLNATRTAVAADLSVNTTSSAPLATNSQDGYQDQIAREVFRRIGKEISIQILPGERSLRNLDAGVDDATFVRIRGIEATYQNVVMVPEKIMDWTFVAFTTDPDIWIREWSDLNAYSVAFMNGWKIFEANTAQVGDLTTTSSPTQLFNLLRLGRTEVVLFEKWSGLYLLRALGVKDAILHQPPLAVREMFMYVHKKHSHLVDELAGALRDMKSDGFYDNIYQETLGDLVMSEGN